MLVLSRKIGEEVLIGDGSIRVMVTGFRGNQVVLGITAPPNVPIWRKEISEASSRPRTAAGEEPSRMLPQ